MFQCRFTPNWLEIWILKISEKTCIGVTIRWHFVDGLCMHQPTSICMLSNTSTCYGVYDTSYADTSACHNACTQHCLQHTRRRYGHKKTGPVSLFLGRPSGSWTHFSIGAGPPPDRYRQTSAIRVSHCTDILAYCSRGHPHFVRFSHGKDHSSKRYVQTPCSATSLLIAPRVAHAWALSTHIRRVLLDYIIYM